MACAEEDLKKPKRDSLGIAIGRGWTNVLGLGTVSADRQGAGYGLILEADAAMVEAGQ